MLEASAMEAVEQPYVIYVEKLIPKNLIKTCPKRLTRFKFVIA